MNRLYMEKETEQQFSWIKWISYIAFLSWSFWSDFHFFDFTHEERVSLYSTNGNPNNVIFYIVVKVMFIVLAYGFFSYWFDVAYKYLKGNSLVIEKTNIILKIFMVYMVLLILMYPGIWVRANLDEFQIVSFTQRLQIQYHQGLVSSLMYILSFMCFPKPVMVVVLQMMIGAIILGAAAFDIKEKSRKAYIVFMVLVFSPAALYFALYPLRLYLFSVLFVAFLYRLLKFMEGENKKIDFIVMTFLVCVLINIRVEIIFLVAVYPLFLLKYGGKKVTVLCAELAVISSLFAGGLLNSLGNQACTKSHNSIMLIGPLCLFLQDDSIDKTEYQEEIADINKVLDVERLIEKGTYRYCSGERLNTFSDGEYRRYLVSAAKIFIKNPKYYVKSKVLCALDGLGLSPNYSGIKYTFPKEIKPERIEYLFTGVNIETHDKFGSIIAGDFYIGKIKLYYVFYAFWIPSMLIFIVLPCNVKSNRALCDGCVVLVLQFILTLITEPTSYQIYFFVIFLAGWYLVIYSMACKKQGRRDEKQITFS